VEQGSERTERIACVATRIRGARAPRAFAALSVVVGFVLAGFSLRAGAVALVFPLFSVIAAALYARRAARVRRGGEITLQPSGLELDRSGERRSIEVTDIEAAYRAPVSPVAVLRLRGGEEVALELGDDGVVDRVLRHLEMAPGQRAIVARLRAQLGAFTLGLLAWTAALFVAAPLLALSYGPLLYALALVAAPILVVRRFGRPRVVVGSDGLRTLGVPRPRFVPYEDIGAVSVVQIADSVGRRYADDPAGGTLGIVVKTRAGKRMVLPTIGQSREAIDGLAHRIRSNMRAATQAGARALAALERQGRSVKEWRGNLRRLALSPGGFRDQALAPEDVEGLLADPSAPFEQRVGAALLLRESADEGARKRIRVAAEGTADPMLREALEAACADEVDEGRLDMLGKR
jgi:hypothetical protein